MSKQSLRKSLEWMLEGGARLKSLAEDSAAVLPDPDQLTTLELLYHLYKEDGGDLVGNPKSVFASYDSATAKLQVFAADQSSIEIVPYRTLSMLGVLNCAQEEEAKFLVEDSQVKCQIGDVQAKGSSYPEAALRALVKHQREMNSAKKPQATG